jgi:hypothetical protein
LKHIPLGTISYTEFAVLARHAVEESQEETYDQLLDSGSTSVAMAETLFQRLSQLVERARLYEYALSIQAQREEESKAERQAKIKSDLEKRADAMSDIFKSSPENTGDGTFIKNPNYGSAKASNPTLLQEHQTDLMLDGLDPFENTAFDVPDTSKPAGWANDDHVALTADFSDGNKNEAF